MQPHCGREAVDFQLVVPSREPFGGFHGCTVDIKRSGSVFSTASTSLSKPGFGGVRSPDCYLSSNVGYGCESFIRLWLTTGCCFFGRLVRTLVSFVAAVSWHPVKFHECSSIPQVLGSV